MKIALSAGHNVYIGNNFDCGAVGNGKREADITKATVKNLIRLLEAQGHKVKDVTPYNQKFSEKKSHHLKRCREVDNFGADLYLDIHINAGGGTGVETWIYSNGSSSKKHAEKICNNISRHIGIRNRGVKVNPNYWSLKHCKALAIIVEGCFIDNANDIKKLNPKNYAEAIAMSFGEIKESKPNTDKKLYRVQTGAFSKRSNADNLVKELKKKGYDAIVVKQGNLYKVQTGAFSKRENADKLVAKLRRDGFEAIVI